MQIVKTITSLAVVGGIMLSTIAPSALADVQVAGNGAYSNNSVYTSTNNSLRVNQNNNANFNNNVSTYNNTGGNSSSYNTGGSTYINTGDANSSVSISNRANSNVANVGGSWGYMPYDNQQNIGIFGNGYGSRNYVNSRNSNNESVYQDNNSYINNNVNSRNNTGYNTSFGNTGGVIWNGNPWWNNWSNYGGSNQIFTGNANSRVNIDNAANSNSLW